MIIITLETYFFFFIQLSRRTGYLYYCANLTRYFISSNILHLKKSILYNHIINPKFLLMAIKTHLQNSIRLMKIRKSFGTLGWSPATGSDKDTCSFCAVGESGAASSRTSPYQQQRKLWTFGSVMILREISGSTVEQHSKITSIRFKC